MHTGPQSGTKLIVITNVHYLGPTSSLCYLYSKSTLAWLVLILMDTAIN